MNQEITITVKPARRDGKHAVSFHFPLSGRTINKVMAHADIVDFIEKDRSRGGSPILRGISITPP